MAKLFKWTERAERKFNQTIMGVNPLCLLQHFIVLAVWERFNQCIKPEYLSIAEVRAKLESIYRESDLGGQKMEDMFQEEEFSLSPEDFPGCQNTETDDEEGTEEFNIGDLMSNAAPANEEAAAQNIEEAGPSGTTKRKVPKAKKAGRKSATLKSKTTRRRRK